MTPAELWTRIDRLPRVTFVDSPTPLELYQSLKDFVGVDTFLVKRDDMTGLAFGGNKVRELEMFIGDAVHQSCDVLVAGGGVAQSNHARQCAAAARRIGMDIHLVLRRGLRANHRAGNLLVTELFDATIHWVEDDPGLRDRDSLAIKMDEIADRLRKLRRCPYVIHSSFHPLGAVGYVRAGLELLSQMRERGLDNFTIYTTSMGATRIGLEITTALLGNPFKVVAVGWRPIDNALQFRLADLAAKTADLLDVDWSPTPLHFATVDAGGPDYGIPSTRALATLRTVAKSSGLLLDPVYSAKGFAGMVSHLQESGRPSGPIVFLHTGGLPAIFAYESDLFSEQGHK